MMQNHKSDTSAARGTGCQPVSVASPPSNPTGKLPVLRSHRPPRLWASGLWSLVFFSTFSFLAFSFCASVADAQQKPDAAAQIELRLREALRATTLQLRSVQTELASLQIVKDEIEKERDAFKKELVALKKLAEAERAAAEKTVDGLNKRLEEKDTTIAELTATGERWKKTAEDTHALAQKLDAERNRLEISNAELDRRAADREAKNVALVRLSQEILARLENFGLGDALTAREPFVRTKRVELQTLVQDYADRITDNKAK